jgi:ketosteroid isomerase-like protein
MTLQLPDVVQMYFDVSNGGDVAQLLGCFCPHATVFDERKTHKGIAAIQAWHQEAHKAFVYQVRPMQAVQGERELKVVARLAGNFPGSPVQLNHIFMLEDHRIRSLEITPC